MKTRIFSVRMPSAIGVITAAMVTIQAVTARSFLAATTSPRARKNTMAASALVAEMIPSVVVVSRISGYAITTDARAWKPALSRCPLRTPPDTEVSNDSFSQPAADSPQRAHA